MTVFPGRKIFSFDAETDGLWRQAFAICALVYDENGAEIGRFIGRLPDKVVTDDWTQKNVLPQLVGLPVTHANYETLLADFAKFYLAHRQDADIIVHVGFPVETRLLQDMHNLGLIADWGEAPYPLLDVSGMLRVVGADPTSVDKFAADHGIEVAEFVGGTHNPLYDSAVTAAVYRYLVSGGKNIKEVA